MDQLIAALGSPNGALILISAIIVIVWQTAIMYSTIGSMRTQISEMKDDIDEKLKEFKDLIYERHNENVKRIDAMDNDLKYIRRSGYAGRPRG